MEMDTEPVLALEPLSAIVRVRQQIHLLPLNPFLVPIYGRGIISHEIEFSFLDNSHDTHTCDVGHRRSEGDVA
jgi:hypothetical protein